jgi:AcrR family transcriptional regulator
MEALHRNGDERSSTRDALLEAAKELMLEEGYASVTSRRVGARAGISAPLIHYYFHSMDDLFVELFRRHADQALEVQSRVLSSDDQPLWALWEWTYDQGTTVLNQEFLALANHRKDVRDEIVEYAAKAHRIRLEAITRAFEARGIDTKAWPPLAISLLSETIAYGLASEKSYGIDTGHAELVAVIQRLLRTLEGERWESERPESGEGSRPERRPQRRPESTRRPRRRAAS